MKGLIFIVGMCMIILVNGCTNGNNQQNNIIEFNGIMFDISNNETCAYVDKNNDTYSFAMQVCGGKFGWNDINSNTHQAKCGLECNPYLPPKHLDFVVGEGVTMKESDGTLSLHFS